MEYFLNQKLHKSKPFLLLDQDKLDEAIFAFLHCIKVFGFLCLFNTRKRTIKDFISKLEEKAKEYNKNKDYKNAITCYYHIYKFDKKNEENIKNYIACLKEIKQHDLQEALAKYLSKNSSLKKNFKIVAQAYSDNKNYKKALEIYSQYLDYDKADSADYSRLGFYNFNIYQETHIPQYAKDSLEYYLKCDKAKPNDINAMKNIISAANICKDNKTAFDYWKKCIKLSKELGEEDKLRISFCALKNDDVDTWAKYYDSRFNLSKGASYYPKIDKPKWDGKTDIKNKTILVQCEQGFGDVFLSFGYVSRLQDKAKKVVCVVQDESYNLLKNNAFNVEVYPRKKSLNTIEFDYHIPIMSIPAVLRLSKEELHVEVGYIKADEKLVKEYREKYFNTKKLKVGIAYKGNNNGEKKRDIPDKCLKMLKKIKGAQLYCLTTDIKDSELRKIFGFSRVKNLAKNFKDFSDTAAAIENCDLIISSDNCVLNLAGAMGKKVIGLFTYHYHSRWINLNEHDSVYYKTLIPIVNDEYDNWEKTLKKAVDIANNLK